MMTTPRLIQALLLSAIMGGSISFASDADAFCGFYVSGADAKLFNNATQVVLMRAGTRTVLSMQNNYQGPPEKFAMVVPVPVVLQKENVKTLPNTIFAKIDQLSAPRLVEYWEQDPCYVPPPVDNARGIPAPVALAAPAAAGAGGMGVKVEAQFAVGEYEIVILSAKDAGGLETWLRTNKYTIPPNAAAYFRPYIQKGSKFFVAKVDPAKVKFEEGMATLSPLRFHYDDESFSLPIRLGLINAKDAQDLVVHVIAKNQRYEVANYPNVTIPTNLDVAEKARGEFGAFYTALFDRTLEKHPKAVVTEYAWPTGSCDPCPGPALDPTDMTTLGGDVVPGPDCSKAEYRFECQSWSRYSDYVVTRLHARYTKESLGEDLVFKAAPPISGGREMVGTDGKLEHGAVSGGGANNFQGRYAIRHPWTGPITCKEPRRNVWGGPPAGAPSTPAPPPPKAKELALAPRGGSLAAFVRSEIPEIDVKVDLGALPPVSGIAPPKAAASAAATDVPPSPKSKCGCDVVGRSEPASAGLGVAAAVLGVGVLRRRRAGSR